MTGPGGHDVVHHCGQGGGLAGAGRAGHQNQALAEAAQPPNHERHTELIEIWDLVRDQAQRQADRAPLLEGVDPESGVAFPVEGEVEVPCRLEAGPALCGEHLPCHLLDLVRAQGVRPNRYQGAVLAHGRRGPRGKDQVRRCLLQ